MSRTFLALSFLVCCSSAFAQQPELVLPVGHTREIQSARFSTDGKLIATASGDATVKIWQAQDMKLVRTLVGNTTAVNRADFIAGDKQILTHCYDGSVKSWDLATGKLLFTFTNQSSTWISLLSPDRKTLIIGSSDSIQCYDVGGKLLYAVPNDYEKYGHPRHFSPDGKWVLSVNDSHIRIRDARTGRLVREWGIPSGVFHSHLLFSNDSRLVIAIQATETEQRADAWNLEGKHIVDLEFTRQFRAFSFNEKLFATLDDSDSVFIYDISTMKRLHSFIAPGSKDVNLISDDRVAISYDLEITLADLMGGRISSFAGVEALFYHDHPGISDSRFIASFNQHNPTVIEKRSGKILGELQGSISSISAGGFSLSNSQAVLASLDQALVFVDMKTGNFIRKVTGSGPVNALKFSTDGSFFVTTYINDGADSAVRVWDAGTGKLLHALRHTDNYMKTLSISEDGKLIIAGGDKTLYVWSSEDGSLVFSQPVRGEFATVEEAGISSDGKQLYFQTDSEVFVVDLVKKKVRLSVNTNTFGWTDDENMETGTMSSDGKFIILLNQGGEFIVLSTADGSVIRRFKTKARDLLNAKLKFNSRNDLVMATYPRSSFIDIIKVRDWSMPHEGVRHEAYIDQSVFSSNGKFVLSAARDQEVKYWDAETGKIIKALPGHDAFITSIFFAQSDSVLVSCTRNGEMKSWSAASGSLLYVYVPLPGNNYLVLDRDYRFDGTSAARKMLYFTCGTDIVEIDQLKEKLWVPGLARRIMEGDPIRSASISEIGICGMTPRVEVLKRETAGITYKITAGSAGIGESVISVNNIEVLRIPLDKLKKLSATEYSLSLETSQLESFFIPGRDNDILLKTFTADQSVSSRGLGIKEDRTKIAVEPPNLYAVMIGVSDYKDDDMDLKYAAKDAEDLSLILRLAAEKLFNRAGEQHVFTYNLNTGTHRNRLPEKKEIRAVFDEIAKKAKPNDILLIFFAGHGVMEAEKKQFYLLTSEATSASVGSNVSDVGISTQELTDWIKPQNIKAQKRVLIFDACNSGQAIRDFVKIGNDESYMAARNDDKAIQMRAMDRLNEKSGLVILSASASNQSAYEMARYSQGLLTYSLLKTLKLDPAVLEDDVLLNLSRWFNAAGTMVSSLARENGLPQEPQIISNTNFNIGMVDAQVIEGVKLPEEKPLFTASNFQNSDESIADDDLEISRLVNLELNAQASRGTESKIVYVTASNSPSAYTLTGRYDVSGNEITLKVNVKQGRQVLHRFEKKGLATDLEKLVREIATTASFLVK